jgi:enoyl-CoA hydratase
MILTGRSLGAAQAEQAGLVSQVTDSAEVLTQALAVAQQISGFAHGGACGTGGRRPR